MHCSCTFFPPTVLRSKVLATLWKKGGSVSHILSSGIMLAWLPCSKLLHSSVATSNYELFHHVIQRKQTSLGDESHLLKLNAAKLRPSDTYGFSLYVIRLHSAKIRDKNGHLKALHSNVNCLQI